MLLSLTNNAGETDLNFYGRLHVRRHAGVRARTTRWLRISLLTHTGADHHRRLLRRRRPERRRILTIPLDLRACYTSRSAVVSAGSRR